MSEESIAFDSVLNLCQHRYRRIILRMFTGQQGSVTVRDITKAILKYNQQPPFTEASDDVLSEIRLSLHHIHLPKLAAKGLIHYNSERQIVEPTEGLEQAQPTLSRILDADPELEAPMKP